MLPPSCPGDPRLKVTTLLLALSLALGGVSCLEAPKPARAPKPPAPPSAATSDASSKEIDAEVEKRLAASIAYGPWKSIGGYARYMAPATKGFVDDDGGVDVAFQFHGAEVAEKDWRQSGLNALIVSVTFPGWGSGVYKAGFADPVHFGEILDDALRRVGASHVRRLLLVSWSAGYAAMGLALSNDHYYALTDAIIVLDGLHADYVDGLPDEQPILIFERFARDAIAKKKTMVVAHSSIVPPGYASTTVMAAFLLGKMGVARIEQEQKNEAGMTEYYHADSGNFHVHGFRGRTGQDHIDQLHLLDELVRENVTPRWTRLQVEAERRQANAPPE